MIQKLAWAHNHGVVPPDFVVLAAARDGVCLATAEGAVEGMILPAPRGEGGFGYDPLFYLPALDRTMAELDAATRLGLSHRGAALRALLPKLAQFPLKSGSLRSARCMAE